MPGLAEAAERQRLAVLGSTGSIGRSTLDVVRHHPERLEVTALGAFGSDLELLESQIVEFAPALVAVSEPAAAAELEARIGATARVVGGADGLVAAAIHPDVDRVVAAVVGAAGLGPVYAALDGGKDVALANKESLVVAGELLCAVARRSGARLLPIDSEHAALHQALRCGGPHEVRRLVLTASGGPFLDREPGDWGNIRPDEALRHPNWEMGAKISVDSATLMNKGLELIEACHLFELPAERIDVVVHPQSILHSMVEYRDGSWIAQLAANDMTLPIQYALAYPERWHNSFPRLDPETLGALEFRKVPPKLTPAVDLARSAFQAGGSAPAVLNAANEAAVSAFLAERIPFSRIVELIAAVLDGHEPGEIGSLEDALAWDAWGRKRALELLDAD